MKKTLLEYLLSSFDGLPESSEKTKPVLKIQPAKGTIRFLPKDYLGYCDVYHSAERWPQTFEEVRPKDGDGCLVLVNLIPKENWIIGILIDKGKRPSYSTPRGIKSAIESFDQIDVLKIGSMIAEELAAGAPTTDELCSRPDKDGYKMLVYITNAQTTQHLGFPMPECVKT